MINGIGHQVRFGHTLTREELMRKYENSKANESSTSSTAPAAKLPANEESKKSSHKLLYSILGLAALTGGVILAGQKQWIGKISKGLQGHYDTSVKPKVTGAWEWAKGLVGKAKEETPAVKETVTEAVKPEAAKATEAGV